ncbi:hypothetical protein [Microbacterium sp. NPDC090003]|uniref:hypothetical protein n=1 Tax=Microbacterium sp. NPDC090003 TaxID=3364203 RepID=UPI0037F50D2D
MAFASVIYALASVMWALFLGLLVDPRRNTRSPRVRWLAIVLVSIWLAFCAERLWHEPAIAPPWLQYALLMVLPAAVGLGLSLLARLSRTPASDAAAQGPSIDEGER